MERFASDPCACGHAFGRTFALIASCLLLASCSQPTAAPPLASKSDAADPPAATVKAGDPTVAPTSTPAAEQAQIAAASRGLALKVLDEMIAAYKGAKSYSDKGAVHIRYTEDKVPQDETAPFSISYVSPNRIRAQYYDAVLACDGKQLAAAVKSLPDQAVVRPAPEKLTDSEVFLQGDSVWSAEFSQRVVGLNPVLTFLFFDKPLQGLLEGAQPPVLDKPEKIDGRQCHRVRISREIGDVVLFVDEKTHELRRVELPTTAEFKQSFDPDGQRQGLKLSIEFASATLNAEVSDESLAVTLPEKVFQVRRFVGVSRPERPRLVGEAFPDLGLVDLAGKKIAPADLKGNLVVLDFWGVHCTYCMKQLPDLEKVYQKHKESGVKFLAVNIDGADEQNNEAVQAAFAKHGGTFQIVRLADPTVFDTLRLEGIPALAVLDAEGKVQDLDVGYDEGREAKLNEQLTQVRAGKNLYVATLEAFQRNLTEYEETLKAYSVEAGATLDGNVAILPAAPGDHLELKPAWTCEGLAAPTNILATFDKQGAAERLFVPDGWRNVVEVDLAGKLVKRHEVKLGDEEVISHLRTAVDPEGNRWFVAFAPLQQRMHLYGDDWRHIMSHPEGKHDGLWDVRFANIDGKLQLVAGYHGQVGVHGVALSGERIWANRKLENVATVTPVPGQDGKPAVICTNQRGTLVVLSGSGAEMAEFAVGQTAGGQQRAIRYLAAADLNGDGHLEYLGLAMGPGDSDIAVGINASGQEVWSYRLPIGQQRPMLEPIATGRLPGQQHDCWILPAPNGTIHFVSAMGKLLDKVAMGKPVAGVALIRSGEKSLLVTSLMTSDQEGVLQAFEISGDLPAATAGTPAAPASLKKPEEPAEPKEEAKPAPEKPAEKPADKPADPKPEAEKPTDAPKEPAKDAPKEPAPPKPEEKKPEGNEPLEEPSLDLPQR